MTPRTEEYYLNKKCYGLDRSDRSGSYGPDRARGFAYHCAYRLAIQTESVLDRSDRSGSYGPDRARGFAYHCAYRLAIQTESVLLFKIDLEASKQVNGQKSECT